MYVQRPDLELALRRALAGTKNIVLSGESGNGKTWLYKRVFSANDVHYETVNLANASLKGGLQEAFHDKVDRRGGETKTQKARSSDFKFQPGHASSSPAACSRRRAPPVSVLIDEASVSPLQTARIFRQRDREILEFPLW
jgi:hypothetical protein